MIQPHYTRHPSGIQTSVNKKVIGMMKDETGGKIIQEFVGLRAKQYSFKMWEDSSEHKRCKGIRKNVVKKHITHDDYRTNENDECNKKSSSQCVY